MKATAIVFWVLTILLTSCQQKNQEQSQVQTPENWKSILEGQLPLLGHRNWVLIVDKAFPMQNSAGITIINTNEKLISVLEYTLDQMEGSTHIKPVIYTDKELMFLTSAQIEGIDVYRDKLKKQLEKNTINEILHDSVFVKMDQAAKLFKVLVLKTNETIPYSSVFIQLDCKYWDNESEEQLRINMSK